MSPDEQIKQADLVMPQVEKMLGIIKQPDKWFFPEGLTGIATGTPPNGQSSRIGITLLCKTKRDERKFRALVGSWCEDVPVYYRVTGTIRPAGRK